LPELQTGTCIINVASNLCFGCATVRVCLQLQLLWQQCTAAGLPGCRSSQLLSNLLQDAMQHMLEQMLLHSSNSSSNCCDSPTTPAATSMSPPRALTDRHKAAHTEAAAGTGQQAINSTDQLYQYQQQMQQALQQGKYAVPAEDSCTCLR
jgi:hypothetical protein